MTSTGPGSNQCTPPRAGLARENREDARNRDATFQQIVGAAAANDPDPAGDD
jgi:hypothetical protein